MTDHAATVRGAIRGEYDDIDRKALVALAALEQERDEACVELLDQHNRAEAAEAALAEAKERIAYLTAEAHGWQPKLAKAEEALRLIVAYSRMAHATDAAAFDALQVIARAALAGEDA